MGSFHDEMTHARRQLPGLEHPQVKQRRLKEEKIIEFLKGRVRFECYDKHFIRTRAMEKWYAKVKTNPIETAYFREQLCWLDNQPRIRFGC